MLVLVNTSNMSLKVKETISLQWEMEKFSGNQTPQNDFLMENIFLQNDFSHTKHPHCMILANYLQDLYS